MGFSMRMGMGLGAMMQKGGGWSPADITNAESWFAADDASLTYDSETKKVSAWTDKISGTAEYAQATSDYMPLWDAAKNAVVFSGDSLHRATHGYQSVNNITFWFVVKINETTSNTQTLWSHIGSGVMRTQFDTTIGNLITSCGATGNSVLIDPTATMAGYRLFIINYIPGGTSRIDAYACGVDGADVSDTGDAGDRTFLDAQPVNLGVYTSAINYLHADIRAFGAILSTMSSAEKADLKTYCQSKYGIE